MILIADSGSTKTEWVLLQQDQAPVTIYTQGINPYFQDEAAIQKVIRAELAPHLDAVLHTYAFPVFYYGAGCSTADNCALVKRALSITFTKAEITVDHDLLAAARALCGKEQGIAAILGTGSNSCLYDGKHITGNNPSLGFIMGDEGSGGYMGKELLKMLLYGELDHTLREDLTSSYEAGKEQVLNQVYHQPMPNRYCASFMPFIAKHRGHELMQQLIRASFKEFFKRHITKYEQHRSLPLSCTGSIAYLFREELEQEAHHFGIRLHRIIRNPMEGLILYHS